VTATRAPTTEDDRLLIEAAQADPAPMSGSFMLYVADLDTRPVSASTTSI
jgi:hypothetical protein